MLKPTLTLAIALGAIAAPLGAQSVSPFGGKQLDPAQFAALMATSQRTMKPAAFVLDHKADLGLTADQLRQIEALAQSQEDSAVVRQVRTSAAMTRYIKQRAETDPQPTGWSGLINEKRLYDEACEQSVRQVETMLFLLRDRQAVGGVLTAMQIDRIMQLEMGDFMQAMKPKLP